MANITLNCANCGAPIQYDGSDVPAINCPFCGTTVAIPPEMRPVKPPVIEFITPTMPPSPAYPVNTGLSAPSNSAGRWVAWFVVGIIVFTVLCVGISTVVPLILAGVFTGGAMSIANSQLKSVTTQISAVATEVPISPTEPPPPTRTPSPSPGYEMPGISFGQKGINPGQFDDSRNIATDGSSTIYVADYNGGRVQAFDMTGKYLYQWKVGTAKTIIQGLAADRKGGVFISNGSAITHVDGKTGEALGKLSNPKGGEFGDLLITPEGNLAAVWYEGRWGMITGLDGHSEDIDIFSPSGKIIKTLSSPISTQTEEPALDVFIAMDGKDNLYALESGVIYVFNPDGKYMNKFGSSGSQPGQFNSPSAIRTNSEGQLIVGDSSVVDIISADGQFIGSFEIKGSTSGLAYDDNGALWVLSNDQVTQYTKPGQ